MEFRFKIDGITENLTKELSATIQAALDKRIKAIYSPPSKKDTKGAAYIGTETKSGNDIYYTKVQEFITKDKDDVDETILSVIFLTKNQKRKEMFEAITKAALKNPKLFTVPAGGMTLRLGAPEFMEREEEAPGGEGMPHKNWEEVFAFFDSLAERDLKWENQFCHNGPSFQPYEPHGVPVLYTKPDGKKIAFKYEAGKKGPSILTPTEERVFSLFAHRRAREEISKETKKPIIQHTIEPKYRENFFADLTAIYLEPERKAIIKEFKRLDFSRLVKHFKDQILANKAFAERKKKKELTASEIKENKLDARQKKERRTQMNDHYGMAKVNGYKQAVGGYTVEPPALFEGRGKSNYVGKIKEFYGPPDIVINIDTQCIIPAPPDKNSFEVVSRGKEPWGKIVHKQDVEWLTQYRDVIKNRIKNQRFKRTGIIKSYSDYQKFEKARQLHLILDDLRRDNAKNLRIAGDTPADNKTKKVATIVWIIDKTAMRMGGVKDEDDTDTVGATTLRKEHIKLLPNFTVEFNFLGKDSIPYQKKFNLKELDPVNGAVVYNNLKAFTQGKTEKSLIFDRAHSDDVNSYLREITGMKGLTGKVIRTHHASLKFQEELDAIDPELSDNEKIVQYELANAEVAIFCNHQKGVGVGQQADKERVDKIKAELAALKKERAAKSKKGESTTAIDKRITTKETALAKKEGCVGIATGTSKQNYLDPRITVAFVRKQFPTEDGSLSKFINKFFSPQLRRDFAWAMELADEDFHFIPGEGAVSKVKAKPKTAVKTATKKTIKKTVPAKAPAVKAPAVKASTGTIKKTVLKAPAAKAPVIKAPVKSVKKAVVRKPRASDEDSDM